MASISALSRMASAAAQIQWGFSQAATEAANASEQAAKDAEAAQQAAKEYKVDAKPIAAAIVDLRKALKAKDSDAIDSAVQQLLKALHPGGTGKMGKAGKAGKAGEGSSACGSSSVRVDAAPGADDSTDTPEEAALRKLLKKLGLSAQDIEMIMNKAKAQPTESAAVTGTPAIPEGIRA